MMFFACSERNKKRRLSQRADRSETGNSGKYLPTDANELGHTNRQHTDADTHNSCTARIEITSIFPIESTERRSQESIALIKEFCPKRIFSLTDFRRNFLATSQRVCTKNFSYWLCDCRVCVCACICLICIWLICMYESVLTHMLPCWRGSTFRFPIVGTQKSIAPLRFSLRGRYLHWFNSPECATCLNCKESSSSLYLLPNLSSITEKCNWTELNRETDHFYVP